MRLFRPRGRTRPAQIYSGRYRGKERAVRQQQQQRATLLAQLKAQEQAIAVAARQLRETQNSLAQLNAQIAEMNAALAKLEKQRAAQERSLAAQLDAAFRRGEHTGIQLILSGEESQRGQRLQAYFGYLNQRDRKLSHS